MIFNCLIAGVGGQGIAFMSRLIGAAAIANGLDAKSAETSGPARRGCSVTGHIRLGQGIHSPLIPRGKADLLIAFEPAEAARMHLFLSPAGKLLVPDRVPQFTPNAPPEPAPAASGEKTRPPEEMREYLEKYMVYSSGQSSGPPAGNGRLIALNGGELLRKCGTSRTLNTALLGAAFEKKLFPFSAEDMAAVLSECLPPECLACNIRAFNAGRELAAESSAGDPAR